MKDTKKGPEVFLVFSLAQVELWDKLCIYDSGYERKLIRSIHQKTYLAAESRLQQVSARPQRVWWYSDEKPQVSNDPLKKREEAGESDPNAGTTNPLFDFHFF